MSIANRNLNVTVNAKVIAIAAIGAGVIVGVGSAFLYSRINSNLNNLVSHLQTTIKEVKEDLAVIENELCDLHDPKPLRGGDKSSRSRNRKNVSFSSSITKSCCSASTGHSQTFSDTLSDTASWKTAAAGYDTDYFSPDEDEFFDMTSDPDDEIYAGSKTVQEDGEQISKEVSNFSTLLTNVDALIDKTPEEQIEAYHLLMSYSEDNNAEILWRKAKACRSLAMIEEQKGNLNGKKDYIFAGYEFALKGLSINEASGDVNKWFAILSGLKGEFLSTSDRIAGGKDFKKHLDIAIQINPNDSILYHLLGRYCYEISMLSWMERKIASTLFGEVPSSSFEEALEHFMSAEELRPRPWKDNKLFIAKCLLQLKKYHEAESWLRNALEIDVITADDAKTDKEIGDLAVKYSLSL